MLLRNSDESVIITTHGEARVSLACFSAVLSSREWVVAALGRSAFAGRLSIEVIFSTLVFDEV